MGTRATRGSLAKPRAPSVDVEQGTEAAPIPPSSSGARLRDVHDARCFIEVEDTEPKIVLPFREPFADERLPHAVDARLVCASDRGLRHSHPLTKVRTVIGRGHDADVRVNDPMVSRKQATIFFTGVEFRVRDEGSRNGTVLNASRVIEYAIRDGDQLLVGDTLFRFRCRR